MIPTTTPLTDTAIRNAWCPDRSYKMFDGTGLLMRVNPSGSKLWRMESAYPVDLENAITFDVEATAPVRQAGSGAIRDRLMR